MKKSLLLGLGAIAFAVGGASFMLSGKQAIETKADVSAPASSKIYLTKAGGISDDFYNYGVIALWNHADSTFNQFTYDSTSGYYCCTISTACTSFNIFRGESLDWDKKWDQSENKSFSEYKNLIVVNSWAKSSIDFSWSAYDGGGLATPNIGTFYMRTPGAPSGKTYSYEVYTYEPYAFNGITLMCEAMGSFGSATEITTKTSETYYNPAGITSRQNSYGILKVSFNYNTLANLGVIVYVNVTNSDLSTDRFQTKDIVGTPASGKVELKLGAYYYSYDEGAVYGDENIYDNFGFDPTNYAKMGHDAAIAYDIEDADICGLSKDDADDLRTEMEGNQGYVVDATWDFTHNYTYDEVYKWVDSQCNTPKLSAKVAWAQSKTQTESLPLIVALVGVIGLLSISGFIFIQKRKER